MWQMKRELDKAGTRTREAQQVSYCNFRGMLKKTEIEGEKMEL